MQEAGKLSLEQMEAFLAGSEPVQFEARDQASLYEWVTGTLREQGYSRLGRVGKGLVRRYIAKMTGRSRAQVTRLIGQFTEQGDVKVKRARRHRFRTRYSTADIGLLALVDEAHDTLSGPATQKILYRGFHEFADVQYERLSSISAAHIYNLRKRREYRERRMNFTKTRPTPVSIGERRKPEPEGRPGYLRIDTVRRYGGQEGQLRLIAFLVEECGANVNYRDGEGITALAAASREGYRDIVEYLLGRGADPNLDAPDWAKPLSLAESRGYIEVVELLKTGVSAPPI